MAIGVIFAGLMLAAGLVAARWMRLPYLVAPAAGLAVAAILGVWCAALGVPTRTSSALLVLCLLVSLRLVLFGAARGAFRTPALLLLGAACATPILLLGAAFNGLETPLSTHDGAFHVEAVEALRRGVHVQTWYPSGFHATAAAVLGLVPWLDSALGTAEVGLGLAILAPLAVFGLARSFNFAPLHAATAAAIVALTWLYPYDYQLWAGWPQGMGILLVLGVWTSTLGWLREPGVRWAVLIGLFGAAIVLTHGIDLYSAAVGLMVIAAVQWSRIEVRQAAQHATIVVVVAAIGAAPYFPALLGWASLGGATSVGAMVVDQGGPTETAGSTLDWLLQVATGVTGAASALDLLPRMLLIGLGMAACWRAHRELVLGWLAFAFLPLLTEVSDAPPLRWLFVVTYPWLSDQRPREIAVIFASILAAIGVSTAWGYLRRSIRGGAIVHAHASRRIAIAFVLLLGFFAEGSGVSIEKRLMANVALQDSFTADDGAAMAWLKQHAVAGSIVVNDRTADAGIWTPYKAELPILLPRSAPGPLTRERETILDHVLDLNRDPIAQQQACALGVEYVYSGAHPLAFESRQLPARPALQHSPFLREVFSSGDAAVFRIDLPCN